MANLTASELDAQWTRLSKRVSEFQGRITPQQLVELDLEETRAPGGNSKSWKMAV
jgi:hypothetical protein